MKVKLVSWWILLIFFLLLQFSFHRFFMSPCSVMGISQLEKKNVRSAFRKMAQCTHPDNFQKERNVERAEVLFKRFTDADTQLTEMLKGKHASCYDVEFQLAKYLYRESRKLWRNFKKTVRFMYKFGVEDWYEFFTVFIVFCIAAYITKKVLFNLKSIFSTLFIRPLPTVVRFFQSPFLRCYVFYEATKTMELLSPSDFHKKMADFQRKQAEAAKKQAEEDKNKLEMDKNDNTNNDKDADNDNYNNNDNDNDKHHHKTPEPASASHLRKRKIGKHIQKRKEEQARQERLIKTPDQFQDDTGTFESDEKQEEVVESNDGENDTQDGKTKKAPKKVKMVSMGKYFDSSDMYTTMTLRPQKNLAIWRKIACDYVQYELLITNAKTSLPLITLVYFGFVERGFFAQICAATLVKMVPKFSWEGLHFVVLVFGFLHTFMGMTSSELEAQANDERAAAAIDLTWEWGFRDSVTLTMNILLGAVFSAASGLGNATLLCTSFVAGVGLRIFVNDLWFLPSLTSFRFFDGFVFNDAESHTRANWEVGYCAGGPFRAFFGPYAEYVVFATRIFLAILPFLACVQWGHRIYLDYYYYSLYFKTGSRIRFFPILLCFSSFLVVIYTCFVLPLNTIASPLIGFFISALVACVCESLLATYDVRGGLQKLFIWIFFIFK